MVEDALGAILRDVFDKKTLCKIEQKLLERHGIDLGQAIQNHYLLDVVLDELLDNGSLEYIRKNRTGSINHTETGSKLCDLFIKINEHITKIILEAYGDKQKRAILSVLDNNTLTLQDIVRACHIPQTSCYRKILSLIKQGLVVQNSSINKKKRRETKYRQKFEQLRIDINGNKIIAYARSANKKLDTEPLINLDSILQLH